MPRQTALIELVVDGLAVHRLTRLLTADVILRSARESVIVGAYNAAGRSEGRQILSDVARGDCQAAEVTVALDDCPPALATLVTCRWCASIWVAGACVVARIAMPRLWRPFARLLALSSLSTLVAGLED